MTCYFLIKFIVFLVSPSREMSLILIFEGLTLVVSWLATLLEFKYKNSLQYTSVLIFTLILVCGAVN